MGRAGRSSKRYTEIAYNHGEGHVREGAERQGGPSPAVIVGGLGAERVFCPAAVERRHRWRGRWQQCKTDAGSHWHAAQEGEGENGEGGLKGLHDSPRPVDSTNSSPCPPPLPPPSSLRATHDCGNPLKRVQYMCTPSRSFSPCCSPLVCSRIPVEIEIKPALGVSRCLFTHNWTSCDM